MRYDAKLYSLAEIRAQTLPRMNTWVLSEQMSKCILRRGFFSHGIARSLYGRRSRWGVWRVGGLVAWELCVFPATRYGVVRWGGSGILTVDVTVR